MNVFEITNFPKRHWAMSGTGIHSGKRQDQRITKQAPQHAVEPEFHRLSVRCIQYLAWIYICVCVCVCSPLCLSAAAVMWSGRKLRGFPLSTADHMSPHTLMETEEMEGERERLREHKQEDKPKQQEVFNPRMSKRRGERGAGTEKTKRKRKPQNKRKKTFL